MDTICREYIKQTQMLFPIIRKKERIYLKSLYNDLIECGSHAAAKEKGLVRLEGKDYVMNDGDIVLFRFNV